MGVKRIKIGSFKMLFVFRHRYEYLYAEDKVAKKLDDITMWNKYELGLFYRRDHVVGRSNFKNVNEWKNNLVYSHMLGINLILCKAWISFDFGAMHLGGKNN
jgi:hypothetical protein